MLVSGLLCVSVAHAQILLDDFTTGPYFKTLTSGTDLNVQTGTMAGLRRSTFMQVEQNPLNQRFELSIGDGFAVSNSGSSVDGLLDVGYGYESDGHGGLIVNDLNLDLSGLDRLRARFLSNDRSLAVSVAFYSDALAANSSVTETVTGGQFSPFDVDFMFADLAGNANMSDVDQIVFRFVSLPSGDYAIGNLSIVPEPASIIMVAIGSCGFLMRRRRKA